MSLYKIKDKETMRRELVHNIALRLKLANPEVYANLASPLGPNLMAVIDPVFECLWNQQEQIQKLVQETDIKTGEIK